jgi:DNA-binding transcriptional regulator YhcF (GntR family)
VRLSIDRTQATPVYLQIKGQIAYGIGTGVIGAGERLPTIRQMAADLQVAPLTVIQAFEELEKAGLIEIRRGVGAFVVDLHPSERAWSRRAVLDGLVARAIEEANSFGISERELARAIWARVFPGEQGRGSGPRVVFVGNSEADTALLAGMLATEFAAEQLVVDPCTIEELRARTPQTLAVVDDADLVIAVPYRFGEVQALVGDRKRLFWLPISVSQAIRERVAQIPESAVVGLVAREASFTQPMRNVIALYRPATAAAPVASFDDVAGVTALLRQVEVVIFSTGVRDLIQPLLPPTVVGIELAHVPDAAAITELRRVVAELKHQPEARAGRFGAEVGLSANGRE